jgi:hypothetical protein
MNLEMAVVPAGGYKFLQRLPNGTFKQFVGLSPDNLLKQVTEFRINNNISIENLEGEIRQGISAPVHQPYSDGRSLRERVSGWKTNRQYRKLNFVSEQEAEKRAAICAQCPWNKLNYADACIECYNHVERDLYAMRQGKTTSKDSGLGACEIYGHDNKTACVLTDTHLRHHVDKDAKAPNFCWLKKMHSMSKVPTDT